MCQSRHFAPGQGSEALGERFLHATPCEHGKWSTNEKEKKNKKVKLGFYFYFLVIVSGLCGWHSLPVNFIYLFYRVRAKNWLNGKDPDAGRDWGQEEKGTEEDEMVGWHHWLDGYEFEQTPGVGDEQGGLACCDYGVTKSWTGLRDWTELLDFILCFINMFVIFILTKRALLF